MNTALLDALDDLNSSRSSLSRRSRALNTIERHLAEICTASSRKDLDAFIGLQDGFEGNVASRILASLSMYLPALQQFLSSSANSRDAKIASDTTSLIQHTQQSLSILQGVALIHPPSKRFLGRKSSMHLLLDILSISREASSSNLQGNTSSAPSDTSFKTTSSASTSASPLPPSLASAVLDTLLCVLVDSPTALRVFEDANGVETVVKTLKRTGVARDIRMKCLEFLYFYLLPEDGSAPLMSRCASTPSNGLSSSIISEIALSRSVPASPVQTAFPKSKPKFTNGEHTPGHVRSKLSDSIDMNALSRPLSPSKPSIVTSAILANPKQDQPKPTLNTSTSSTSSGVSGSAKDSSSQATSPKKKSLALQMLQRDVDYVPMSPKKAQVARLGVGTPLKSRSGSRLSGDAGKNISDSTPSTPVTFPSMVPLTPLKKSGFTRGNKPGHPNTPLASTDENEQTTPVDIHTHMLSSSSVFGESTNKLGRLQAGPALPSSLKHISSHPMARIRSTEEKKELLGAWLGNVDALVEGVQKAGVWGLA